MKRTHLAAAAAATLALIALALILFALRPQTIIIETEGLDDAHYRAAQSLVGAAVRLHPEIGIELAPRAKLSAGLEKTLASKPSLLVFRASAESDASAESFVAPTQERIGLFSRSFLWPVLSKGKPYAYPLFFDHYEFDRLKARTEPTYDGTLRSFGKAIAADKAGTKGQTFLACGDDAHLGALASSLIASYGGISSYDAAVRAMLALPSGTNPEQTLAAFLSCSLGVGRGDTTVRDAMLVPVGWALSDAINQGWLREGEKDLAAAVKRGDATGFATFLSHHRTLDPESIQLYDTVPMPVYSTPNDLGTVNPVIALGVLRDPAKDKRLAAVLDALLDPEAIYEACRVSGLVPGASAARSPDVQARDVRSWILGSARTIRGLNADAFRTGRDSSAFFAELRVWLMAETEKAAR